MASEVESLNDQYSLVGNGEFIVDTGPDVFNIAPLSSKPSSPKVKGESESSLISDWGDGNDFPQKIIEAAELSTELPSLLDWQARALQGKEVVAYQRYFDAEAENWKYKPVQDEEIDSFLQDTTFKRYMREAATDFFWFWNVFPELIKSADGNKIAYLGTQDASFCRWARMNEKGIVKQCYVNAKWPDAKPTDSETIVYEVIDPYSNERIEDVQKSKKQSFIYPVSAPSPGKSYYQLAKWNGFLTTGWADIARRIPQSKRSLLVRMLSARYMIKIPFGYWSNVYKDWPKMDQNERLEAKKKFVKNINEQLTGTSNEGKTILTEFGRDINNVEIQGIEIVPIEQVKLDGNNLEDSREASEHLMRALGVDPTLVGDGPGKKLGGGSGSDKRVAFNIYVALLQPYRDIILEPLYYIAEYNGWMSKYKGLCFKTIEIELETLDKSHSTSKEVAN